MQENQQETAQLTTKINKKILIGMAIALVLAAGVIIWFAWAFMQDRAQEETPSAAVAITSAGFTPSTISIQAGEDVEWVNQDSVTRGVQGVAEDLGLSTSEPIEPSESYSFVFDDPGTYTYYDPLKPEFKATVIVVK